MSLLTISLFLSSGSFGIPIEDWNVTFGGPDDEEGRYVQETSDGGYITIGSADSNGTTDSNVWLIKTDALGTESWNKTYDHSNLDDSGYAVLETNDGNYILIGSTIIPIEDVQIAKAARAILSEPETPDIITFGKPIVLEISNGYVVAGWTEGPHFEGRKLWLTETDFNGTLIRRQTLDLPNWGVSYELREANDGYIVADPMGVSDGEPLLVMIGADSAKVWDLILGDSTNDQELVYQTSDGGNITVSFNESEGSHEVWVDVKGTTTKIQIIEKEANLIGGEYVVTDPQGTYNLVDENGNCRLIMTDADGNETWSDDIELSVWDNNYRLMENVDGYVIAAPANEGALLATADENGSETWHASFDLSDWDGGYAVQITDGGEFIITVPDNDNVRIVKADLNGTEMWNQTFEISSWDESYAVVKTDDGYIIVAPANSEDRLVKIDSNEVVMWSEPFNSSWNGGYDVLEPNNGDYVVVSSKIDYNGYIWLIKADESGQEIWNETFGASNSFDMGYEVLELSDGYVIVGGTSLDENSDVLLMKTDFDGNEIWNRTFGELDDDGWGRSAQETSDMGFVIVGWKESADTEARDLWLIKTDAEGNEMWDQLFGGTNDDEGWSVREDSDGNYVIAGSRGAFGDLGSDAWLIKVDADGNEVWKNRFGGTGDQVGKLIRETSDGGYLLTGFTEKAGNDDFWVIKTDSGGAEVWDVIFEGSKEDQGFGGQETSDGGYILVGYTESYGSGGQDVWLIKMNSEYA